MVGDDFQLRHFVEQFGEHQSGHGYCCFVWPTQCPPDFITGTILAWIIGHAGQAADTAFLVPPGFNFGEGPAVTADPDRTALDPRGDPQRRLKIFTPDALSQTVARVICFVDCFIFIAKTVHAKNRTEPFIFINWCFRAGYPDEAGPQE